MSIKNLEKVIDIFKYENRPITVSYIVTKYNIGFYSVKEIIKFLLKYKFILELDASINGKLYVCNLEFDDTKSKPRADLVYCFNCKKSSIIPDDSDECPNCKSENIDITRGFKHDEVPV